MARPGEGEPSGALRVMSPARFEELCLTIFGPGWREAITLCTGIKRPGRLGDGRSDIGAKLEAWIEMLASCPHPRRIGAVIVADALGSDVGLADFMRFGNSPRQNGQPNGS